MSRCRRMILLVIFALFSLLIAILLLTAHALPLVLEPPGLADN